MSSRYKMCFDHTHPPLPCPALPPLLPNPFSSNSPPYAQVFPWYDPMSSLGLFLRVWNKFITSEFERILEKQANKTNNHNKVKQNKTSFQKQSSWVLRRDPHPFAIKTVSTKEEINSRMLLVVRPGLESVTCMGKTPKGKRSQAQPL